ncbi:MAG TPA: hypothetical protein VIX58_04265, partial [Anaerolineae bacterium]
MDSLFILPLIFIFNFAALAIGRRFAPARYRVYVLPALAGLALIGLAFSARDLPHSNAPGAITLFNFTLTPSLSPRLTLDFVSLFPFIVVLVGWGALALLDEADDVGGGGEWLWLAALFPLVTAGNILTLIGAMLFNDVVALVYFARRESATTARRYFVTNQLGTFALLVAAVLASASALDLNSDKLVLSDVAGFFALVSIGIRLNLFPFHVALPFNYWLTPARPLWSLLTPGVMTLAVLARLTTWLPAEFANAQWLYAWVFVSLMFAGIQAWRENNTATAFIWLWQIFLTLAFAVPLFATGESRVTSLAVSVAAAFAPVLIECAQRVTFAIRGLPIGKVLYVWAIAMLAGVPLTAAFLARLSLYAGAWDRGLAVLIFLALLGLVFGLSPLAARWWALAPAPDRAPTPREGIALGVVAAFVLLTSLTPLSLLSWVDPGLARSASQMTQ